MGETPHPRLVASTLVLALGAPLAAAAQDSFPRAGHGAVGSWFGRAVEVCQTGVPVAACTAGLPAIGLFMTPTLNEDGTFIGNDSLALGAPPFGPHTTAHGQWVAIDETQFTVDYTFMLNTFPPTAAENPTVSALRFRWAGRVVDEDTAVGFVNLYFMPPVPSAWEPLADGEFPTLPPEAQAVVTPPSGFVTDPNTCRTQPECPLVFKFTIKRVAP